MTAATSADVKAARLAAVAAAAAEHAAARARLEQALVDAHAAGLTLRPIAAAAGLSPEWTRRLIAARS